MSDQTSTDEKAATGKFKNTKWQRFFSHRLGMASLFLLGFLLTISILSPVISPHAPDHQYYGEELMPPSATFLFGTDDFGRDILTRSLYGMRLSLGIGLLASISGGLVGIILGIAAGFIGGWIDDVLGRIWDTLLAFPALLLGLAVAVGLGPGTHNAAIAAALINIPIIGRIARAGVLGEQEKDYIQAAHALGASSWRITALHLLPNIFPVLLVQITLTMAHAMIIEAGLSFLGLGAQPPTPSLGTMLRDARAYMNEAIWYAVFPGLVLTLLLLLLSYISDALSDAFDTRRNMGKGL